MIRARSTAIWYSELVIHIAASKYLAAASRQLGLRINDSHIEALTALLEVEPELLVGHLSTRALMWGALGALIRVGALAILVALVRCVLPIARLFPLRMG